MDESIHKNLSKEVQIVDQQHLGLWLRQSSRGNVVIQDLKAIGINNKTTGNIENDWYFAELP